MAGAPQRAAEKREEQGARRVASREEESQAPWREQVQQRRKRAQIKRIRGDGCRKKSGVEGAAGYSSKE
jgi:hypothetical protein